MIETFKSYGLVRPASRKGRASQLRSLSWREITARLDGARQLRGLSDLAAGEGSFAPATACRIAFFDHGKRAVNPAGLANLKAGEGRGVFVNDVRDTAI